MKKLTQIKQNIYLLKMNKKTQIFDSIYFRGKSYFKIDGTQNCLVFQPLYRYFKLVVNSDYVIEFKSKGTSDESIKSPSSPHNFSNPSLNYLGTKTRVRSSGSYLKQDKIIYIHGDIVNIYIVYETRKYYNTRSYLSLENTVYFMQLH